MATRWPSSTCRAANTIPMPPSPSCSSTRYLPSTRSPSRSDAARPGRRARATRWTAEVCGDGEHRSSGSVPARAASRRRWRSRSIALLFRPALLADQGNEADARSSGSARKSLAPTRVTRVSTCDSSSLPTGITSRPPGASCCSSASGTCGTARRDGDRVVGRVLGPAERAVAVQHVDVVVAEPLEPLARFGRERLEPLHREHLARDPAEHGGGVARARCRSPARARRREAAGPRSSAPRCRAARSSGPRRSAGANLGTQILRAREARKLRGARSETPRARADRRSRGRRDAPPPFARAPRRMPWTER